MTNLIHASNKAIARPQQARIMRPVHV